MSSRPSRINLAAINEAKKGNFSPKNFQEKKTRTASGSSRKPSWLSSGSSGLSGLPSSPRIPKGYSPKGAPKGGSRDQFSATTRISKSPSPAHKYNPSPQRAPSPSNAAAGRAGFSQTQPLPGGRVGDYPIRRDDDMFRAVQAAWMTSWQSFTTRLKDPNAPSKTEKTHSRQVLEVLMRVCEEIPSVTCTEMWEQREADMAGRAASDVINQWSTIANNELNANTPISDRSALQLLVGTTAHLRILPDDQKNEQLASVIRVNRNVASQLLSSCSACLQTVATLHTEGVLSALVNQIKTGGMDYEAEDMTLQSFLHFLIQGSYVWRTMPKDKYPARDWARLVGRVCLPVLKPRDSRDDGTPPTTNARGRALMAILVRISPHRCPEHHLEHTRAMFEVPTLLHHIVHWFYERHSMPESFDDVATEIVRDLVTNTKKLPGFLSKPLQKALKFGQPCALCERVDNHMPLVAACACKMKFYCSRACQTEHWQEHKADCKAAWQEEVLAKPVGTGVETKF